MTTYRVFRRSCVNWTEFSRARKTTIRCSLSYSEARQMCRGYNFSRTPRQMANGTMYEMDVEVG